MPENPSRSTAEALVRELLIRVTKESLALLTDSVTPQNAMRVLTQIGKTALAHRKTLTLYGDFQLDEELEGSKNKSAASSSGFGALLGGTPDRETAAVHMLRELVSSYQNKQRIEQVGALLLAAEKFRVAGDIARAEVMEAKARGMADAAMYANPKPPKSTEEMVNVMVTLANGGLSPDVAEVSKDYTTPFSDATGANVWGATHGDAMNGDSGTAPHPGEVEEQEQEDDEPPAPGYNVPI
jgi:hypothetical protein